MKKQYSEKTVAVCLLIFIAVLVIQVIVNSIPIALDDFEKEYHETNKP